MAILFSVQLHVNTHINTQHGFPGLCLSPRTHAKSKSLLDFVHFTCSYICTILYIRKEIATRYTNCNEKGRYDYMSNAQICV